MEFCGSTSKALGFTIFELKFDQMVTFIHKVLFVSLEDQLHACFRWCLCQLFWIPYFRHIITLYEIWEWISCFWLVNSFLGVSFRCLLVEEQFSFGSYWFYYFYFQVIIIFESIFSFYSFTLWCLIIIIKNKDMGWFTSNLSGQPHLYPTKKDYEEDRKKE